MKKVIANKNITINDIPYLENEELYGLTYEQIAKLNEKGLIKPLTYEDLIVIKRELDGGKNTKENVKETKKND